MGDAIEAVVIIGAGPAGMACAWRLAQLGFSPLLLEKATFPRDKVCGDALSGKAVALLRKLGGEALVANLARQPFAQAVDTLTFIGSSGRKVSLSFPPRDGLPQGFVVPRLALDAWLAAHLPPTVRLRTGACVEKVAYTAPIWTLFLKSGEEIRTRFLVGADGATSRVGAWLWRYYRLAPPVAYPAVRGYASTGAEGAELALYFQQPYLPGYLWDFPAAQGRRNIGLGMPPAVVKRQHLALRQHLLSRYPGLEGVKGHGIPVSLRYRPIAGPACALVGDAAVLTDPFTGEGIANALLSGVRLAEALGRVPLSEWPATDWMEMYARPLYRELRAELHLSRLLHRLAASSWQVEVLLWGANRLPSVIRTLVRWYGGG
ncbi:MAG: NAD(P)/FAD-dependent oxidoreductase [Bacteroidia bacterium]|jgi:flavin-dependent dehydrogenase|nr:NAD(P)/FAD-dependent oxidoreductase [Bacteroidia bacterium]GIV22765.1 MAG: menaquinone reductase [Bacteroidia bacterium]